MRFDFGKNWQSYSHNALTPERIEQARQDFRQLVDGIDLQNKHFIDIGFGQGLSLIVASEMGASTLGIDIDELNILALKTTLKLMGSTKLPKVQVESILNPSFVGENKGRFDIVHSWGGLHHTGNMRQALVNSCSLVADNGYFICSIYNQHWSSFLWKGVKWSYNYMPPMLQPLMVWLFYPIIYLAKWIVTGKNPKRKQRGMDFYHDVVDWVGGYPYEYASEHQIQKMVSEQGFKMLAVFPARVPTGANEYIFRKDSS